MTDYGRPLEFGVSLVPDAAELEEARAVARRADALGLDLLGIQDHPYQWRYLETWMLMATLLAETERLRVFPDVANLPLRLPAMIAKQAASLDVLSGGRFELGLGAGSFWEAIGAMGGPARSPREALEAHEEAIRIIRLYWSGERTITFEGRHYSVKGLHPGPPPTHPIGIWLGVLRPGALALTGRLADGWVPSVSYAPPDVIPGMTARIDEAAAEAGRQPAEIRRVYNVMGRITDEPAAELLQAPSTTGSRPFRSSRWSSASTRSSSGPPAATRSARSTASRRRSFPACATAWRAPRTRRRLARRRAIPGGGAEEARERGRQAEQSRRSAIGCVSK